MNEGVRILIERMQTNPEDFEHNGKFVWVADDLEGINYGAANKLWFLTEEDYQALKCAWAEKVSKDFSARVMRILFEEPRNMSLSASQQAQIRRHIAQNMSTTNSTLGAQGGGNPYTQAAINAASNTTSNGVFSGIFK